MNSDSGLHQPPATDTAPDDGSPGQDAEWFDPDSREGAAILDLLARLRGLEHSDGSWPGAEVVDTLTAWLGELGISPYNDPESLAQWLRTRPHPWTVLGLRDNHTGATLIAAVVPGVIDCHDTDPGDAGFQRVAEAVTAAGPDDAEHQACQLFENADA